MLTGSKWGEGNTPELTLPIGCYISTGPGARNSDCAICRDGIEVDTVVVCHDPCQQVWCSTCLQYHLDNCGETPRCPQCRMVLEFAAIMVLMMAHVGALANHLNPERDLACFNVVCSRLDDDIAKARQSQGSDLPARLFGDAEMAAKVYRQIAAMNGRTTQKISPNLDVITAVLDDHLIDDQGYFSADAQEHTADASTMQTLVGNNTTWKLQPNLDLAGPLNNISSDVGLTQYPLIGLPYRPTIADILGGRVEGLNLSTAVIDDLWIMANLFGVTVYHLIETKPFRGRHKQTKYLMPLIPDVKYVQVCDSFDDIFKDSLYKRKALDVPSPVFQKPIPTAIVRNFLRATSTDRVWATQANIHKLNEMDRLWGIKHWGVVKIFPRTYICPWPKFTAKPYSLHPSPLLGGCEQGVLSNTFDYKLNQECHQRFIQRVRYLAENEESAGTEMQAFWGRRCIHSAKHH